MCWQGAAYEPDELQQQLSEPTDDHAQEHVHGGKI